MEGEWLKADDETTQTSASGFLALPVAEPVANLERADSGPEEPEDDRTAETMEEVDIHGGLESQPDLNAVSKRQQDKDKAKAACKTVWRLSIVVFCIIAILGLVFAFVLDLKTPDETEEDEGGIEFFNSSSVLWDWVSTGDVNDNSQETYSHILTGSAQVGRSAQFGGEGF